MNAKIAVSSPHSYAGRLETVKHLRLTPITRDVLVAFYDAQEPPYFLSEAMGSTRLLVDVLLPAHLDVFPIILDLCGHDVPMAGLDPAVFVVGLETDLNARKAFERTHEPEMLMPLPMPNLALGGDFSDYHAFNGTRDYEATTAEHPQA